MMGMLDSCQFRNICTFFCRWESEDWEPFKVFQGHESSEKSLWATAERRVMIDQMAEVTSVRNSRPIFHPALFLYWLSPS